MILNLTQHDATPEQVAGGVVEPVDKAAVQALLTFKDPPTVVEIESRAEKLAKIALDSGADVAMIGGAPYLMPELEEELNVNGIEPWHSFTKRITTEKLKEDGTKEKVNVFKHGGWVKKSK